MSGPDLKDALRLVGTLGLAPLKRVANTRPKNYFDNRSSYDAWTRRLREVEAVVIEKLRAEGAAIVTCKDPVRVRFAGIAATSTMGLEPALKNWQTRAQREYAKRTWRGDGR